MSHTDLERVEITDTFDEWRQKDNLGIDQINNLGDTTDDLSDRIEALRSEISKVENIAVGNQNIIPLIIALS